MRWVDQGGRPNPSGQEKIEREEGKEGMLVSMNRFQMVSATHLLDSSGGIGAEVLFSDAMRRLCAQTSYLQEKKEDDEVGS